MYRALFTLKLSDSASVSFLAWHLCTNNYFKVVRGPWLFSFFTVFFQISVSLIFIYKSYHRFSFRQSESDRLIIYIYIYIYIYDTFDCERKSSEYKAAKISNILWNIYYRFCNMVYFPSEKYDVMVTLTGWSHVTWCLARMTHYLRAGLLGESIFFQFLLGKLHKATGEIRTVKLVFSKHIY